MLNQKIENGKNVSPLLDKTIKNFLIDIDGTICEDIPNEEPWRMIEAKVFEGSRDQVNKWYDDGHLITFFTSRTDEHREITKEWLKNNNFKYHNLLMNKPRGGNYIWVDNHIVKGVRYKGVWSDLKPKLKTVHIFEE